MFCSRSAQGEGSAVSLRALSRITKVSETSRSGMTLIGGHGSKTYFMEEYDKLFQVESGRPELLCQ